MGNVLPDPPPKQLSLSLLEYRSVPAFFRFLRPASGFGAHDTSYEEFKARWKPISDADVFGGNGGDGQSSSLRYK